MALTGTHVNGMIGEEIFGRIRKVQTAKPIYVKMGFGHVAETVEVVPSVVYIDKDEQGKLLGVEILSPSQGGVEIGGLYVPTVEHLQRILTAVRRKLKNVRKHAATYRRYKDFAQFADLKEKLAKAETERDKLREAIISHRSQKADDRCIEDDDRLYEVLGDGVKCDRRVGCKTDMLKNCKRFIQNRCEGGGWKTYAELEAENKVFMESLEKSIAELTDAQEALKTEALYKCGPGDKVVCIIPGLLLEKGRVYEIEKIGENVNGDRGFHLKGISHIAAFSDKRFKPEGR